MFRLATAELVNNSVFINVEANMAAGGGGGGLSAE